MKNENREDQKKRIVVALVVIALTTPFLFAPSDAFAFGLGILAGLGIAEVYRMSRNSYKGIADFFLVIVFVVYFCISLFLLYKLRFSENGVVWLLYVLILTGIFDASSYLLGKRFGKHKISSISPKKTREGFVGGTVSCWIISLIVGKLLLSLNILELTVISLIIAILAFLGDLFESFLKRRMRTKDSGTLLRSHGGVLDRIDSVLMVSYGVYILKFFVFL